MRFSIIIPTYGNLSGLRNRLWEIHDNCLSYTGDYEIIVVDDKSPDTHKIQELVEWTEKNLFPETDEVSFPVIRYHKNKINFGFGMSCNTGFNISEGEIVIFISTDVKINQPFLHDLDVIIKETEKVLVGGKLLNGDTGWNTFDSKTFPYLEGWFIASTQENFINIGGFDPIFGRFDYEDIDLSTTALSMGYQLKTLPEGKFTHISGASIVPETGFAGREKITKRNKKVFENKWVRKE